MALPVQGPNVVCSATPGTAVVAIQANQTGGYIVNPVDAADQGVTGGGAAYELYVNQVQNATNVANGSTIALQPGQSYTIVPNSTTPVTVSSKLASHQFTAVQWV